MAWSAIHGQLLALEMLQAHLTQQRVAPAYLFAGPDGVGKRLAAIELAKALNCEGLPAPRSTGQAGGQDPCDRCGSCQRIMRQTHPDVHLLSPQGALEEIRLEDVHQVLGRVALHPFMARLQVAVIDGADRLTEESANSLLKSLEEPPRHTRFILITSQPGGCLPTIVSRCQTVRFQRLPAPLVEERLIRTQQCEPRAAAVISRLSDGSLSRAIELAAQWPAYQEILAQLASGQPMTWLEWFAPTDRQVLSRWLVTSIGWLRDVAIGAVADEAFLTHREFAAPIRQQAQAIDPERCIDAALQLIKLLESLEEQLVSPRLVGTLLRETWLDLTTV